MQGDSAGFLPTAGDGGAAGGYFEEGEQLLLDPETGLPRESDVPAVLSGSDEVRKEEAQVKMKYVLPKSLPQFHNCVSSGRRTD